MTNIVTLYPTAVTLGGWEYNTNPSNALPAPALIGDGDIGDDSDATGLEIGTRFDGLEQCDIVFADFTIPATPTPLFMYVALRARNSAGADAYASDILTQRGFYRTDDPGNFITYEHWPTALEAGTETTAAWYEEAYAGNPILPGEPSDATNWLNFNDWPELLDPLTTTGLRVGIFATSTQAVRVPLIEMFELRLIVACESSTTRRAHLRQYPRSPLRHWPPERSVQRSNRQGPGAYR